jgi:hypothetical protein
MKYPFDQDEMPDEEALEDVGRFLNRWQAPAPDPAAKARLMTQLMQARIPADPPLKMSLRWAGLILWSQTRIISTLSWTASALLLALGMVVTLFSYSTPNGTTLPMILIAPVVAAAGVAFLYGEDVDPPLELQLTTPVSPRLILLARLALLFGFNLVLALVCSMVLALTQAEISLLPLVLSWLAPMTFLSALAFLLSVMLFNTTLSITASIVAWFVLVWRHFADLRPTPYATMVPDLLRFDLQPLLFVGAVALVWLALWLSEREERFSTAQE